MKHQELAEKFILATTTAGIGTVFSNADYETAAAALLAVDVFIEEQAEEEAVAHGGGEKVLHLPADKCPGNCGRRPGCEEAAGLAADGPGPRVPAGLNISADSLKGEKLFGFPVVQAKPGERPEGCGDLTFADVSKYRPKLGDAEEGRCEDEH